MEKTSCTFVSCTKKASIVTAVTEAHWAEWLSTPLDFAAALEVAAAAVQEVAQGRDDLKDGRLCTIELGAHPVMASAAASLVASTSLVAVHASTMRRGVSGAAYLKQQRGALVAREVLSGMSAAMATATKDHLVLPGSGVKVLRDVPFADQGIASAQHPLLAAALKAYFPGIGPHDFYRYTSLEMLCAEWDSASSQAMSAPLNLGSTSDKATAALEVSNYLVVL